MTDFDEFDAFEGASLSARAMARPRYGGGTTYYSELNEAQKQAVDQLDGPVLMLAGAGTGKTKALMARFKHLLVMRNVSPDQILAVTFTNKAAQSMQRRLGDTPYFIHEPIRWMGTFHSICVKQLRRESAFVGLKSNFTILDSDDQLRLLKQLVRAENIDDKRWPVRSLSSIIEGWKNKAWRPNDVPVSEAHHYNGRAVELYAQYQERLIQLNAADFGDLLLHMVAIFRSRPDVLEVWRGRFRYILVDEYQDTNVAQYLWLRLLAGGHKNICCVGDDDQSIYGWRGAEVGNILRFEKDFPGAVVVRLEQNYRSTPHILAAASGVIRGNAGRLGKELWTAEEDGEKVRLIGHWDGDEEARWVGEEIEAMQRGTRGLRQISPDEMAILVRASHQMRAFEDRFLTIGLPYRVIGGPRFYERMEIRDAMAYFRLVVSPSDDLAFERVVNTPKRGLGDKAQQTIQRCARENGVSLVDGAALAVEGGLIKGKGAKELSQLLQVFSFWQYLLNSIGKKQEIRKFKIRIYFLIRQERVFERRLASLYVLAPEDEFGESDHQSELLALRDELSQIHSRKQVEETYLEVLRGDHVVFAKIILDESGYTGMWQNDKTPEAPGRLENLKELVKALENFENLQGFLEHVSLIMDNESDDAEQKVSIMTLHAAKGLEFPAVFLPGWEDGLFPSQRSMDESGIKGLEEERRLAYVGITRAEEVCTISFAGNRRIFGQWQSAMPSRFIDEIPEEHVEILTPPGLYGGGYGAAASTVEARASAADGYNSPGWKRMQARAAERPVSQPRESRSQVIDLQAVSAFSLGDRVFHQKFGYGAVVGIEGDKLDIAFDKAGQKKVVAKFVSGSDDIPF